MHAPRTALAAAAVCAIALLPAAARATDCTGTIVSTCIDSDTLWPNPGQARFVGVSGAETTAPRQLAFGLVTSYQSRPIRLHIPFPPPGGSDQFAIDDQVTGTFLFAYGVTQRLELGLALPVTFGQGGSGVRPITGGGPELRDTAVRDLRFGLAYALSPRARVAPTAAQDPFAVTARFALAAATGDREQFAGDRGSVWIPSVVGDYRRGRWFGALEVGARLRPTTELLGTRVGSQIVVGLGAGADVLPRELLSVMVEARALPTLVEQHTATQGANGRLVSTPNGKAIVPAEWDLAVRTAPLLGGDLGFVLGGGSALPLTGDTPATTPRFRFTLGIRYAPMARDTDGDGVPDRLDKCPTQAAAPVVGAPRDGCPHEPSKPDPGTLPLRWFERPAKCAREPAVVGRFREADGCPSEETK